MHSAGACSAVGDREVVVIGSDTDSDDSEEYIHVESDYCADALYSEASSEGEESSKDDEHKPSKQEPISIEKKAFLLPPAFTSMLTENLWTK